MKATLRLFFAVLVAIWLPACANMDRFYHGVRQGMYYGLIEMSELKNHEPMPPLGRETPSYGQYDREREEMLRDLNKDRGEQYQDTFAQPLEKVE